MLECANGFMNYDHHDVSKRIKYPICLTKVNILNAIVEIENTVKRLQNRIEANEIDNDTLCEEISESIYNACKANRKPILNTLNANQVLPNHENCNFIHCKAVANIYLFMYQRCLNQKLSYDSYKLYLNRWIE